MMPASTLAFGGIMHAGVQRHLFPGDGREAAAILLCAHTPGPRLRRVVRDVVLVPHVDCPRRTSDALSWPGLWIEKAIDAAETDGLTLILTHSHLGGLFSFSDTDDASDRQVIPTLFHAFRELHGTAIMTSDGAVRARLYTSRMCQQPVELVTVAGNDLVFWWDEPGCLLPPSDRPVAFTGEMTSELARLHAAVIGVSGTGSIVAE